MLRFLIGLALGYLAYWVIKKVAVQLGLWPQAPKPLERDREPDVLVQDPVCKTFIPRSDALKTEKGGQTYFFCSEGCLKRFLSGGRS
jgi:uncharacterized protein